MKRTRLCLLIAVGASLMFGLGCARDDLHVEIVEVMAESDYAFRGVVVEVGESNGFWTDFLTGMQPVVFELTDVYRGDLAVGETLTVTYILVDFDVLTDREEPRLRDDLFAPGQEVVVFANEKYASYPNGPFEKMTYFVGEDGWLWRPTGK